MNIKRMSYVMLMALAINTGVVFGKPSWQAFKDGFKNSAQKAAAFGKDAAQYSWEKAQFVGQKAKQHWYVPAGLGVAALSFAVYKYITKRKAKTADVAAKTKQVATDAQVAAQLQSEEDAKGAAELQAQETATKTAQVKAAQDAQAAEKARRNALNEQERKRQRQMRRGGCKGGVCRIRR